MVVGRVDGQYVINPDEEQRAKSDMHVYLAGTKDAIMMVEAGANEVSETAMLDAIMFGHEYIKKRVEFQDKIVAEIGKEKVEVPLNVTGDDVKQAVREFAYDKCVWVFDTFNRQERQAREAQVKQETIEADLVLLALGFLKLDRKAMLERLHLNDAPNVFLAGDTATGPSLVVRAIVDGRKAAARIDRYLSN